MDPRSPLPSLKSVERALRETTERLAQECACPRTTAPNWDDFHWCIARAVAAIHGVSPLLSKTLPWRGPRSWCGFLDEQWQHTFNRHQRLAELLARIDARARAAQIPIMALKGVALHDLGLYAAGARPMADVDLLVRDADAAAASTLLVTLGYRETHRTRRERTFAPGGAVSSVALGENSDNAIKIELHTRIAERLPLRETNITGLLLSSRTAAGLCRYGSMAALMTHLLLHAAGSMRTRSLRLIQLNDIAALCSRLNSRDWDELLRNKCEARTWWAYPPLALTARYYPQAVPVQVLSWARAACPRLLRRVSRRQRLSDVSLSQLRIEFCPGIEWCGSISEALRYMQNRAFPDRAMRVEIQTCESTDTWAINSPWTALSRAQRVTRWLFTRPPRPATMWPVRLALDQSGLRTSSKPGRQWKLM